MIYLAILLIAITTQVDNKNSLGSPRIFSLYNVIRNYIRICSLLPA